MDDDVRLRRWWTGLSEDAQAAWCAHVAGLADLTAAMVHSIDPADRDGGTDAWVTAATDDASVDAGRDHGGPARSSRHSSAGGAGREPSKGRKSSMRTCDAVIVGADHNGLVVARSPSSKPSSSATRPVSTPRAPRWRLTVVRATSSGE